MNGHGHATLADALQACRAKLMLVTDDLRVEREMRKLAEEALRRERHQFLVVMVWLTIAFGVLGYGRLWPFWR